MDTSGARRAGSVLLVAAGLAVLLGVVAVASRGETGAGGAALGAEPLQVLVDATFYLVLALAAVGLAIVVWVFWPRPDEELPPLPPRRRVSMVSTIIATCVMAAVLAWLRVGRPAVQPGRPAGSAGAGPAPPAALAQGHAAGGFDWLAFAIVAALLVGAGVAAWLALRPRRSRPRAVLAGLTAVLDVAIEDVLAEEDPRRAVVKAWARLERVLSRYGLGRRDAEAPLEYARRAERGLEMETVSLERLADLFEWARFSLHDVTPAMREEAVRGLIDVRDGLRGAT